MSIHIDFRQASDLLDLFGGEPGEFVLTWGVGHSGEGLYAHVPDYPEEGAHYLGKTDGYADARSR